MTNLSSPADAYTDLEIRIHAFDEERQVWPTEATVAGTQDFGDGVLRLELDELRAREGQPEAYGMALFYALFSGPLREAYDRALGIAAVRTEGRLRIRLWIDQDALQLHALPWEQMYYLRAGERADEPVPLTVSADVPFSRMVRSSEPDPEPLTGRPIRLLVAISNPQDLEAQGFAPIDVAVEIESLREALDDLLRIGLVQVTLMPGRSGIPKALCAALLDAGYEVELGPTTLTSLVTLMARGPGYHILHFLGHGRLSRKARVAALVFEDPNGSTEFVRDSDLRDALQGIPAAKLPRLAFLASCESAKHGTDRQNPFVGLAPRLVRARIPAVVAMQDYVALPTARMVSRAFYAYLLDHGAVDKAMNQARLELLTAKHKDWAVPVLITRLSSGQLFASDPIRALLHIMVEDEVFNPLPVGSHYLPLEALHITGGLENVDLSATAGERASARRLVDAVEDIFAAARMRGTCRFIALIGGSGMGKSIQLRHIGKRTAEAALLRGKSRAVPVYIDLQNLDLGPYRGARSIENLVKRALTPFFEKVEELDLKDLYAEDGLFADVSLRIIVDGSEMLPDHLRRRAWRALNAYVGQHPDHQVLVTSTPSYFDSALLDVTDLLIMQPLSSRALKEFLLESLGPEVGQRRFDALERSQLLDLAALPWLLFQLLGQFDAGRPPRTHSQVLRAMVEDKITEIATDRGMRARARQTLYTLAWKMQSTYRMTMPLDDAFEAMALTRGKRGYSLEAFYLELIRQGLLTAVGADSLRFARPYVQSYCAAQKLLTLPDRAQVLDNIASTLGRYTCYDWWEDTLTLLSGMIDDPSALIRQMLYGVALSEGEQVFLAVRCIVESRGRESGEPLDDALLNYVLSALLWRLDSSREPDARRRARIATALGRLGHAAAVPHLARVVNQPVRVTLGGEKRHELSSVRLAAVQALRKIVPPPFEAVAKVDPYLSALLNSWQDRNIDVLEQYLVTQQVSSLPVSPSLEEREISATIPAELVATGDQAIAAFALGDLQTKRAVKTLIRTFLSRGYSEDTYRNVTTALTLLNPGLVMRCVILPLIDPDMTPEPQTSGVDNCWDLESLGLTSVSVREGWHENVAYLIGRIRAQDQRAHAYLHWCLYEFPDVQLKALAIQSLGQLYDRESKPWLEDIAQARVDDLGLGEISESDLRLLQRRALEALYYIGDADTLTLFKRRPEAWSLELELTLYRTSEAILSRHSRGQPI